MRGWIATLAILGALTAVGAEAQEPPADDPLHAYVIEASLDPEAHTVEGTERITWVNEAERPAHELWLHLYLNAFESRRTVFMRESGGQLRGDEFTGEGGVEVLELAVVDGEDLLPGVEEELIAGDRTQMRVPLPEPVPPGGTLDLHVAFRSTLPPVFARSGYHGTFHMVAQWFPKLAVRERDGTWVSFPYHGRGEFYADFARYDLTVTTPAQYVVGATGELVEERVEDGTAVRRFVAERVHDTAFCAWDHFRERAFEAEGVRVRLLYPPGYDGVVDLHERITTAGLAHFGALFGEYPYPALTVILPPRGAEGAAGMEYPTLFTSSGDWWAVEGLHIGGEATTAHELGHMWFQGMVASNEVRWPMLDEGITQWATGELLREVYGQRSSALHVGPMRADFFQAMRVLALRAGPPTPPPGSPAHVFGDSSLGRAVYGRTAIVLDTIGRVWGSDRLEEALGLYAREQRFRHPTPEDLFDAFDRVYWRGFSARVLAPALMEGHDTDVRLVSLHSDEIEEGVWASDVTAERVGELPVPTTVELEDEAGQRVRIPFPVDTPRLRTTHVGDSKVVRARVDPDQHLLLDPSVRDNTRGRPVDDGGGLFARVLFAVQQLLGWVGP